MIIIGNTKKRLESQQIYTQKTTKRLLNQSVSSVPVWSIGGTFHCKSGSTSQWNGFKDKLPLIVHLLRKRCAFFASLAAIISEAFHCRQLPARTKTACTAFFYLDHWVTWSASGACHYSTKGTLTVSVSSVSQCQGELRSSGTIAFEVQVATRVASRLQHYQQEQEGEHVTAARTN